MIKKKNDSIKKEAFQGKTTMEKNGERTRLKEEKKKWWIWKKKDGSNATEERVQKVRNRENEIRVKAAKSKKERGEKK